MLQGKQSLTLLTPTTPQPEYPLFVFLPGMDGTGRLYQRQAQRLCHWFDIRCLSIPADDFSNWDDLANQLIALINAEIQAKHQYGGKTSVYLCGESFGGCLALQVALKAPKLLEKLILVNPASCFNQRPLLSLGIPLTKLMPNWLHRSSAFGFLPFLAALERIKDSDRRALHQAMQSLPAHVVSWRLSLLQEFSLSKSALKRLTMPVLLIVSGSDYLLPSVEAGKKLIKHLPLANMFTLPESGHACLLETQVNLDEIIQKGLGERLWQPQIPAGN